MFKIDKSTDIENWLPVVTDWGNGELGVTIIGPRVSFCEDGNILKFDSSDSYKTS